MIEKMKIVKAAPQTSIAVGLEEVFPMVRWKKSKFGERGNCWGT